MTECCKKIISLFDVVSILNDTTLWLWKLGILLVIGAVGYILGDIKFRKKDLPLWFPETAKKGVFSMKSVKQYKIWAIILSVCTILLGISLLIWPGISALTACYLLGAICIAMGIYELIRYFDLGLVGILFRFDLSLGIFSILSGVLLLCHPQGAMTILPIILGFYIVAAGIFSIQASCELHSVGASDWWLSLISGIIGILLGALMIFDPFSGAETLMVYIGISLLIVGIQNICTIICLSKSFRSDEHQKIINAVWHVYE